MKKSNKKVKNIIGYVTIMCVFINLMFFFIFKEDANIITLPLALIWFASIVWIGMFVYANTIYKRK
jgi:hypothetical protein